MSQTMIGYRSTDPEVLESFAAWLYELGLAKDRLGNFITLHDPEKKFDAYTRRQCEFSHFRGDADAPAGWRKTNVRGEEWIVPDKRTKLGKKFAAELEKMRQESPRVLRIKGMPVEQWVPSGQRDWSHTIHNFGAFLHDGALYVHWGCLPEGVDAEIWTELKLSEFHAAREASEAESEPKVA